MGYEVRDQAVIEQDCYGESNEPQGVRLGKDEQDGSAVGGREQRIEMTARDLRRLADAMGPADEVTVIVGRRLAESYWHKVATRWQS